MRYQIKSEEGWVQVDLTDTLEDVTGVDAALADAILAKARELTPAPSLVIFNLVQLRYWKHSGIRMLTSVGNRLKSAKLPMRIIGAEAALKTYIAQNGLDELLPVSGNLSEALQEAGIKRPLKLDAAFVNTFLDATLAALRIQSQTEATAEPPRIGMKNDRLGDISGVIGLFSDAFSGSISISFPEPVFLDVVNRMLGSEYTEINEDVEDAAGELLNIIFGLAKTALNRKGHTIEQAIPAVVRGRGHSISGRHSGPRVVIPFATPAGKFFVEVCLQDRQAMAAAKPGARAGAKPARKTAA